MDFRRDEKGRGEKSGEKINFLECLAGVILGEKIGGAKYFLSGLTKTFSPQFREKNPSDLLSHPSSFCPLNCNVEVVERASLFFVFFFFSFF